MPVDHSSTATVINNEDIDIKSKQVATFRIEQKNWEETASDSRSSARAGGAMFVQVIK